MNGVATINVTEEIALITFNDIPCDLGLIAAILQSFSDQGINIDMISQAAPFGSNTSISFTVDAADVIKSLGIINRFRETHRSIRPMVSGGNCKIQLYGEEMRTTPGVAAAAFQAAARATNEVMLITTSEVDISLLVPQAHENDVVAALKKKFSLE